MVQRVSTVAFEGIEARAVDVQVQVAPGLPAFHVVGLGDKAVSEARERVRAALTASGLALPARRIIVNLAPADLPKEGSHYDLPIALGLMAAIGAIPHDALSGFTVLGELGLDGSIAAVAGGLPAAIGANARNEGLICPAACGAEAAWASPEMEIVAASSLIQLANHFKGTQVLRRPQPKIREMDGEGLDLNDIKGQESAKRALEVAAAGGHNLLMVGPPGAGKSMLAARLPSILPPLSPTELLEVSMIASVAGEIAEGALTNRRPFRAPHHSASMPALVGGGLRARPGEISLAHNGVLFLDELPGIPGAGAGFLAAAAGNRRGRDRARQSSGHLSGPFHADCGDESLPLRTRERSGFCLPPRAESSLYGGIPGPALRAADRPG
jgi:magnesium chelatase family protein